MGQHDRARRMGWENPFFATITFTNNRRPGGAAGQVLPPRPEKTQAQKQKDYEDCFHSEMQDVMQRLQTLMRQNLMLTDLSAVPGGVITSLLQTGGSQRNVWGIVSRTLKALLAANIGIGTSVAILPALYNWKRELKNLDRDV